MPKISDKLRDGSFWSESDATMAKIYRLFRREKTVRSVLGGSKRDAAAMRSTQTSRMMTTGFNVLLLAVTVGVIGSGGFALLLGFVGLLAGACLIAVRVQMADDLAPPMGPAVIAGVGELIAFLRHNIAVVGVALASSAVTVVASEESPLLRFSFFALFLLGTSLVSIGVHGE